MTFTTPLSRVIHSIKQLFITSELSQTSARMTVPKSDADRYEREVLREMILRNHNAIQSDQDVAALMALYPRPF